MRRSPDYIVCVVPICIFQTTFDDIYLSTSSVQVGETKWLSKSGDFVMERTLVNLTTLGGANIFGERMGARRGWDQSGGATSRTDQSEATWVNL